jgi:hypothetical protein
MYSVLKYHYLAKDTEFYFGQLRLNMTSTGNEGCLKKNFTRVFQMLLCGECYENDR